MSEEATKTADTPFTAGETTLLITIMQHLNSDIDFDAAAVATKLGYKDGSIVKTRWRQIRNKKIGAAAASAVASPAGITKRTTKKGGKAAAAPATEGNGDVGERGDGEVETPVKTPAKRGRKPKVKKEEEAAEGEVKAEEKEEL